MRPDASIQYVVGGPGRKDAPPERAGAIPTDLLQAASRRLAWASLSYGTLFLAVYAAFILTVPGFCHRETFAFEAVSGGASILIALFVFAAARSGRLRPQALMDIGLLFEVFGGLGISLVEHWGLFGEGPQKTFGISWICVWIVFFPLLVPSTPGKALLTALVTASTGIFAFALSVAFGRSQPQSFPVLMQLFLPSYVSAFMAFLAAKVVYGLGSDVREARRVGAYELTDRIGAGGMGEVWKARHRFLSRPAAVKLIRPAAMAGEGAFKTHQLRHRFEREAQATASLRSPHSIVLYDFGSTEGGDFYYVMELLKGLTLQSLVDRFGPVPANRGVHLLKQMSHSLMDAHQHDLIHRDIKPANIIICRLGPDYDFAKVLDFGLAKSLCREEPRSPRTVHGICGTPGYIAPELILGAEEGDPRTDIYSLGCLAVWLLTGHPVFSGDSVGEILRAHLTQEPVPLSSLCEVKIPAELDRIVLSCLTKNPRDRIQSVDELLERLTECGLDSAWSNLDAKVWWETHAPSLLVEDDDRERSP